MVVLSTQAFAQLSEDFEPTGNQSVSTKDQLIMNNWLFKDFDINPEGCDPITGTQSFGSGPSYDPAQRSGMVTPFLTLSNSETVQFSYALSRGISSSCRRWFVVYLADSLNNVEMIDSVEVGSPSAPVNYTKTIANHAGTYVIFVNVKGDGCYSRLILDNFSCTASVAPVNHPAALFSPPVTTNGPTYNNYGGKLFNEANLGNATLNADLLNPAPKAPATSNHADANANHKSSITDNNSNQTSLLLYPNPSNGNVNLQITANSNQEGEVEVYNVNGAIVMSQPGTLTEGVNTIKLNVSNLAPGSYYVSVKTSETVYTKSFVRAL